MRHFPSYSDLIHGDTSILSLVYSDSIDSSFPYIIWTSDPGGKYCQNSPNQEKISEGGYITDEEPMDSIGPNINENVKEGIVA